MHSRRERVTAHPLQSRENSPLVPDQIVTTTRRKPNSPSEDESITASSHSSLTTTINTASLIQSAARSVLDEYTSPTSTTNVSDDENDNFDDNDDNNKCRFHRHMSLPTLESLQQESSPALPSDDDRKRFVGCLAAVLASSYDYDVGDEEDDRHDNQAESYAYLNRREQGHDSDEEGQLEDTFYATPSRNTKDDSFLDTSRTEEDYPDSFLPNVCSTSFEDTDISLVHEQSFSVAEPGPQQQRQKRIARKEKRKSAVARSRHRKRRYDILSQLLLSSAELLLLDKSQARAFLPMLARVLMPPSPLQKAKGDRLNKQQKENATPQISPTKSKVASKTNSPARSGTSNNNEEKGINRYHFSPNKIHPSSTEYVSQRIPLNADGQPAGAANNNRSSDMVQDDKYFIPGNMEEEDHLRPFLESLTPGAGYRCLSLLLLQHLLCSSEGYDARIRHVIKKLGVIVLVHDMELERDLELVEEPESSKVGPAQPQKSPVRKTAKRRSRNKSFYDDLVAAATRKFEALEHSIAVRLIQLSKEQKRLQSRNPRPSKAQNKLRTRRPRQAPLEASAMALSREQIVRGMKIGSAGLVAGTIFAVTGGLAAPGIAAGLAAIAGSTAATAAVAALVSSTPAVTAIFGVGGGSLAAYKMNRRTQGLTEFEFRRQDKQLEDKACDPDDGEEEQAELFSTVCISGWLRDQHDFQRPWGVAPSNPRIRDQLELLERFYAVYRPDHVLKCKRILASWKGEERQLWSLLKEKYGRDPDHLYPIVSADESSFHRGLTLEQEEALSSLFAELGYIAASDDMDKVGTANQPPTSAFDRFRHPFAQSRKGNLSTGRFNFTTRHNGSALLDDSLHGPGGVDGLSCPSGFESVSSSQINVASGASSSSREQQELEAKEQSLPPKHISTVWDYKSRYGGELYTVKWESEMLVDLCDSVTDLAFDVINGATAQLLRQTALHTLLTAVAIPYALVNAANMIDGTWTLAVERADEAGKELCKSLLFSRAGHRPVTLVGFSFGARVIYSCLKELAKYQEKWETSRENSKGNQDETTGHHHSQGHDQYSWTQREPASIVEDVIVMGLPNHMSLSSWRACRQIVGGRLVNCYSRKDLILSLMFQIKRLHGALRPVCGTCPVDVPGVENVDVSDLITGHQDYCLVTGEILKRVRHGQPFRSSTTVDPARLLLVGA